MADLSYLVIAGTGDPRAVQAYIGGQDPMVALSQSGETARFVVIHELEDATLMYGEYLADRLASGLYGARHFASLTEAVSHARELVELSHLPTLRELSTAELPPTSAQLATIDVLADRIEREVTLPSSRAAAAALILTLRARVEELVSDGTIPA